MAAPSVASNSDPPAPSAKRKSWFSLHRRTRAERPKKGITSPPPSSYNQDILTSSPPQERFRPIQFSPNRIATLYVTPSERNLYLAAMAQLDEPPKPLPLWAEPAPNIPELPVSPPMSLSAPNHLSPTSPRSPSRPHPLTTRPMSPKLVTSPGQPFPGSGLHVRDEFPNDTHHNNIHSAPSAPQPARHALLSMVPNSYMKFTGLPPSVLLAVDQTVHEHWPPGVWLRSEKIDNLRKRPEEAGANLTYKMELYGTAWKRKASQELDTIRLTLAILTTLGVHGWIVVDTLQASGMKKESHNLLLAYSPETRSLPPAFFALSLPVPDRLSVISPPATICPAILNAIRNAISQNAHLTKRSQPGNTTPIPSQSGVASTVVPQQSKRATLTTLIGTDGRAAEGVKLEGWVHHGVYRFWIAGMRRWLGGGVKQKRVDNLHPQLLISIMNNLSALHFGLVGSIPVFPLSRGRDVLYFSSLPGSGLSYVDTYKPARGAETGGSESPVFISPTNSMIPAERFDRPVEDGPTVSPRSPEIGRGQRDLPWTSILDEDPPVLSPTHRRFRSGDFLAAPPPSAMTANVNEFHERSVSHDSSRPLIRSSSNESSPRHRNVLVKKTSKTSPVVRRNRTASGDESVDLEMAFPAPMEHENEGHDEWSMIDAPELGRLGMTSYESPPPPAQIQWPVAEVRGRKLSQDTVTTASGAASIYEDTQDTMPSDQHASPGGGFSSDTASLTATYPLAQAIEPYPEGQAPNSPERVHLRQNQLEVPGNILKDVDSPRRAGEGFVDVGSGLGIPSMHGSVGYLGSRSVLSGVEGRGSQVRAPVMNDDALAGRGGGVGQAEHGYASWGHSLGVGEAEHISVPPPVPAKPDGWVSDAHVMEQNSSKRAGSARTRLSVLPGRGKGKGRAD